MYKTLIFIAACLLSTLAISETTPQSDYYVSADRLSVRLGPSGNSIITNTLNKNQKIEVFEIKNGWARISKYYDGKVEGKNGEVARWVSARHLSKSKSADNFMNNTPLEKSIKSSDNYAEHRDNFINISIELINSGTCSLADYKEQGGWVRSSSHKPKPIYFTYCGGISKNNKVYINAKTGKIYK